MVNEVLKVYRMKRELTQEEFAQKIGVSRSYYALVENGTRNPSPDVALAIEKATGGEIKKEWLVFPEEYKKEIEEYLNKEPAGAAK